MDGKELLSRLKRLSQIEDPKKDIHGLTYAQFPGTHCPLMALPWRCGASKARS